MDKPSIEYTAKASSPIVNGDAKMSIGMDSLIVKSTFDIVEVLYARVNSIEFIDHIITIRTDDGEFIFSKMGQWGQPFYDALCIAYNNAVLKAFFISGDPVRVAGGDYKFAEEGSVVNGKAPVRLYENCVVLLPPNSNSRRIPLCFTTGMDKGSFELTLKLDDGDSYTLSKLGYDTKLFAEGIENQIRLLRERTLAALKEFDPSLSMTQSSQIAKIMPEGIAVPIGKLEEIAPSFKKAVEERIEKTRASESYKVFKKMCDPSKIWVGFRKIAVTPEDPAAAAKAAAAATAAGEEPEGEERSDHMCWLIAPSKDGQFVAVESSEKNTATFVYRTGGDPAGCAAKLNRSLEAINFRREVIRLSDDELLKPEYASYYMASKRTRSLQFIRKNFVTRIIHSSPEAWKRKLEEAFNGK